MAAPAIFDCDPDEPLALLTRPMPAHPAFGDAGIVHFEFSSRGDRVPGRLRIPARTGVRHPLILLQHGIGGSVDSPYMEAAAPWVRGGAAVASIDFPLHGERANPKLAARLIDPLNSPSLATDSTDPDSAALQVEFARQAVLDLRHCLDALSNHEALDADRVVYAGFSLGAILGALFCAADARPRAAALALGGGGFGPPAIDPCQHVARFAPRPLLFVNALSDERIPRQASEALFQAAADPKSIEWFEAPHHQLPGVALKAMWHFLRDQLGLPA